MLDISDFLASNVVIGSASRPERTQSEVDVTKSQPSNDIFPEGNKLRMGPWPQLAIAREPGYKPFEPGNQTCFPDTHELSLSHSIAVLGVSNGHQDHFGTPKRRCHLDITSSKL